MSTKLSATTADDASAPTIKQPRRTRRWIPLAILLAVVSGLHYGIWKLLTDTFPPTHVFSIGLAIYLAGSALAIPVGLLSLRTANQRLAAGLSWIGLLALGMFSSLFVLTALRTLIFAGLDITGLPVIDWGTQSAWAAVILACLATLTGLLVARASPVVVHVDIPIAGLPEALHGFRIAQITDIHVGPTIRRGFLQRIVDKVNSLEADLIAITGDVVDGEVASLRAQVAPLQGLRAREGVALVLGNHELYSGALEWVQEFRRLGLQVLLNEHVMVRREGASIAIAGVTDHTTERFFTELACDPHAAIRGEGQTADVRVLLAHQPITAIAGATAGYHLALHGHTHGGQWWPWNHFVRMQQPVVRGLHRFGEMWSYTSVGTGYWGPPKRHFRSEITLLTLRHVPSVD